MKLVVLTNILAPYRIPLFESLKRRVGEFTVLLMAKREENRQWEIGAVPFKTELLPGFHVRPGGHEVSLHINYGVLRVLRRLAPDVVLSGGFAPANVAALLYCKLYRRRFVGWGELTLRDGADSSFLRRGLRRWVTTQSDGSIASSSDAREAFLHYGGPTHRTLLCLMPIDVDQFRRRTEAFRRTAEWRRMRAQYPGPVLLSVGRLTDSKGYPELFKMYRRILEVLPEVSLVIVGDGPERGRYQKHVRDRGWKNVRFSGFVQADELPRYLAVSDLFVFPTRFDRYGAVLGEAMAAGLPVVSSIPASATKDLVEDGKTGFRIDPQDIDTAAATIVKALEMTAGEREAMTTAAYARVKQLDSDAAADSMTGFFLSLLDPGRCSDAVLGQAKAGKEIGAHDA